MKPRLVRDEELEIRPVPKAIRDRLSPAGMWLCRTPGMVALHCANISTVRGPLRKPRRLVPRLYVMMAALPAFALGAILFAGAMAKALRWATFQ